MSPLARVVPLALILLHAGCAMGPKVVQAGPQTYMVSSDGGLSWNETTAPAREAVFLAANRFCAKRKLVMVPVSVDTRPSEGDDRFERVDLVFRALRRGDPEIARSQAIFRRHDPMVVRESIVNFTPDPADTQPERPTGRRSAPRP
jgi:hypothetical protein